MSNKTRSDFRRDHSRGAKTPLYMRTRGFLQAMYSNCDDPEKLVRLAEDISAFGGAEAELLGVEAKIDVAQHFCSQLGSKSLDLLAESGVRASEIMHNRAGSLAIKAAGIVNEVPLRLAISQGQLPSVSVAERQHKAKLKQIPAYLKTWDAVKDLNGQTEESRSTKGLLVETAVELLLERYAIYTIGTGWTPIKSTFSQDRARLRGDGVREGWDISILTEIEADIADPTHKLQVKSSTSSTKEYSDGIDIVHIDQLRAEGSRSTFVTFGHILNELYDEQTNPTNHLIDSLDSRTEVLLDMFN